MTKFISLDLETSGLNPHDHDILEVAMVGDEGSTTFSLPYDPTRSSEEALKINRYLERFEDNTLPPIYTEEHAVEVMTEWLNDAFIVGKNPSFDVGFVAVYFEEFNVDRVWHHRLVDVGSLAWGWLNAREGSMEFGTGLGMHLGAPMNTEHTAWFMYELHGIEPPGEKQHTALADAEWCWKVFRTIVPKETDN